MSEAVQEPVQRRDGAVRPEEPIVTVPWQPRTDDKSALLVSERATVFDRKAKIVTDPVDPMAEVRDPIFDHQGGACWSPELVHCRLVEAGRVYLRLPDRLRTGELRSFLGNVALVPQEGQRRVPPSPMEISIADWTFERIYELPAKSRELVQSRAFGASFDKIEKHMRTRWPEVQKRTLINWYQDIRRVLAADWQQRKHPIDTATFRAWQEAFAKRLK
jgi:hypothetical protein